MFRHSSPDDEELAATESSLKEMVAEEAALAGLQSQAEEALRWLGQIAVKESRRAGGDGGGVPCAPKPGGVVSP